MSYQNVIMYSACLPSYSAKGRGKDGKDTGKAEEHLDTRNPEDMERINKLLFG